MRRKTPANLILSDKEFPIMVFRTELLLALARTNLGLADFFNDIRVEEVFFQFKV